MDVSGRWRELDGGANYAKMLEEGIVATRQLAKRQLTWLRAEPGVAWLDSADPRSSPAGAGFGQTPGKWGFSLMSPMACDRIIFGEL